MNFLALYPQEYQENLIMLSGSRAAHLKRVHQVQVDKQYRLACIGSGQSIGCVEQVSENSVSIRRTGIEVQSSSALNKLIVGACRPQSVKKILQLAIAYRIAKVVFTGTELGQKSYLSSKILTQPEIQQAVFLEAIEQSGQVFIPQVSVYSQFRDFQSTWSSIAQQVFILADFNGAALPTLDATVFNKHVSLLVGPEAGWSQRELESFATLMPLKVKLAPSVLRVEQAVAALVAVLFGATANSPANS